MIHLLLMNLQTINIMKITVKQKEENGIYTCSISCQLVDVNFGNKTTLETNKETKLPYTQLEIDNVVADGIEDFIKRYEMEQKRLNEKTNY